MSRLRYLIFHFNCLYLLQIVDVVVLINFDGALTELCLIDCGKCVCAGGRRNLLRLEIVLVEAGEILLWLLMSETVIGVTATCVQQLSNVVRLKEEFRSISV